MNIKSVKIENFRGYREKKTIEFDGLTLIVGKNDIGKSTILEAMDIFFGNSKIDKNDVNIECEPDEKISISVEFTSLPKEIDIDEGARTSLRSEYLLNANGSLEIKKVYNPLSPTSQPKTYIIAMYPKTEENLLALKNADLKKMAADLKIDETKYTKTVNNSIRKAIWQSQKIELRETQLEIDKEDGKKIYAKIEQEMPLFCLFSADRKNSDQDAEIQDPIKNSVKEIIKEISDSLEPIKKEILDRIDKITKGTIEKLKEINPEVANSLRPISDNPAWEKAFNVTIESDGVPLNKRGSGVKRLVLISFFREEAERKRNEKTRNSVFYAIEEPETSQHPDWQAKLFKALEELVESGNVQVGLTTHHPELAGLVKLENIRFIEKSVDGITIKQGSDVNYKDIAKTLGVLPHIEGAKVCVCLEGPHDVIFLRKISRVFGIDPDDEGVLWLPLGGDTLRDCVNSGCLNKLSIPQIHFYDQDSDQKYKDCADEAKRQGHWAELTKMLTIENYIHPLLYKQIWIDLKDNFVDATSKEWLEKWAARNIPRELSAFMKLEYDSGNRNLMNINEGNVKKRLANNASLMTKELFDEMGTFEELNAFFGQIRGALGIVQAA